MQHAFFSFTPAIKFLIRDVFVVFPLSMLKLAEVRLMTSWCIYLRYLINRKYKTMKQILPQLFLLLSSHPSSVQLILFILQLRPNNFSIVCRQIFLNSTLKKKSPS